MCLFYRGSITVLECLFCRSSTMSLQERYHMIILQDQYYVFVIQKHVYAFNFQEQYHFILQDHCHYLFSGAVSCSFYRSSDMLILQEHYGVFILQEQCVFILQEQSHFTWVASSLFLQNMKSSRFFSMINSIEAMLPSVITTLKVKRYMQEQTCL